MLSNTIYSALKKKAEVISQKIGKPLFYGKHRQELEKSSAHIATSRIIHKCRTYLDEAALHPAHGLDHGEKVALEAGAILQIEAGLHDRSRAETEGLMLCVQIAGLLHDIKRNEKDHTIKGSLETGRILADFSIPDHYKRYITAAIRNHEAFKEVIESENDHAKLVSDSLYDADKFRWGPDNFTSTLWLIVESAKIPVEELHASFMEKVEGIKRIKNTFRTETGRLYGPQFINMGLEIGNELYMEMERYIGSGR